MIAHGYNSEHRITKYDVFSAAIFTASFGDFSLVLTWVWVCVGDEDAVVTWNSLSRRCYGDAEHFLSNRD